MKAITKGDQEIYQDRYEISLLANPRKLSLDYDEFEFIPFDESKSFEDIEEGESFVPFKYDTPIIDKWQDSLPLGMKTVCQELKDRGILEQNERRDRDLNPGPRRSARSSRTFDSPRCLPNYTIAAFLEKTTKSKSKKLLATNKFFLTSDL